MVLRTKAGKDDHLRVDEKKKVASSNNVLRTVGFCDLQRSPVVKMGDLSDRLTSVLRMPRFVLPIKKKASPIRKRLLSLS